jgi:hypothetical protein
MLVWVTSICIDNLLTMNRPTVPAVPNALALDEALQRSEPLADLRRRMNQSADCLRAVRTCLPEGLLPHVHSGPIDADGWTLLAANAAVAAKLKHLRPRIEAALVEHRCATAIPRIKVLQRQGP